MASVATATRAELEALSAGLYKAYRYIDRMAQGELSGPTLTPAQVTLIDAQLTALKAAVDAILV